MSKARAKSAPSEETKMMAMYIAVVVRNEMEDFHVENLSDKQMKELNPIIRNAICTALHAAANYGKSDAAKAYVDLQTRSIPRYWEELKLTEDYLEVEEHFRARADGKKTSRSKAEY